MNHRLSFLLVAGFAAVSSPAEAQTVTVLPFASPRALSRDGVAATGWQGSAPFLWKESTGPVAVTGSLYNPRAVCDGGAVIAGLMDDPFGTKQGSGFWAETSGEWMFLGGFPGVGGCPGYGEPYALSADGSKIAGELFLMCNLTPYTWTQSGGYNVLPITGSFGAVRTLAGDGSRVGGWDTHPTLGFRRAALWDSSNVETFPLVFGLNPDGEGEITAMNHDGSIFAGQGKVRGAFVNRNGAFTEINVPNNNSLPTGVSDDGTVVVGSYGSPFTGKTPWVWTESGGAKLAAEFFFDLGIPMPSEVDLTEMMGVSRDGLTFLAAYDGVGAAPNGAVIIQLPVSSAWTDLGGGTSGANGVPSLTGSGPLTAGSTASVELTDAATNALMLAWISFAPTPFAALGGTVHSFPFTSQLTVFANASGTFTGATIWPTGVPAGTGVWFQFLVEDASTLHGITLSNGVKGTAN